MKKIIFYLIIIGSIIISCKKKLNSKEDNSNDLISIKVEKNLAVELKGLHCYRNVENKVDTIYAKFDFTEKEIKGILEILPDGKDSRKGTLNNGRMYGDTLVVSFNSEQEGETYREDFAFLKKNNSFILLKNLYDEKIRNASGHFFNRDLLKFDGGALLSEIDCK